MIILIDKKRISGTFRNLYIFTIAFTLFSRLNTITTIKNEIIPDLLLIVRIHLSQQRKKNFNKSF